MKNKKPLSNVIQIILGKKGSGKTTLAVELLKETNRKHTIIWDFLIDEFYVKNYSKFMVFDSCDELVKYYVNESEKTGTEPQIKAIIRPIDNIDVEFSNLCEFIWHLEDCEFLIEEADSVISSAYTPDSLGKLIRYGRHKKINIIAISRRPPDLSRLLTSQADLFYIFKFTEPRDIEYIKKLSADYNAGTLKKYEYKKIEL